MIILSVGRYPTATDAAMVVARSQEGDGTGPVSRAQTLGGGRSLLTACRKEAKATAISVVNVFAFEMLGSRFANNTKNSARRARAYLNGHLAKLRSSQTLGWKLYIYIYIYMCIYIYIYI